MHPLPQAVERLSAGHIELNFSAEFDCNCLCPATVHMCTHTHIATKKHGLHTQQLYFEVRLRACCICIHDDPSGCTKVNMEAN